MVNSMRLNTTITNLVCEYDLIPAGRKKRLEELAACIIRQSANSTPVAVTFICTHNSRRSHMAQLWAQAAASHFRVRNIRTYSGGTEATAFYPSAVAALNRLGFSLETEDQSTNPVYQVRDDLGKVTGEASSRVFGSPPNPASGYIAVLTCSSADAQCPVIAGCTDRIVLPYDDPKQFDGTMDEAAAYTERCRQIGREMLYTFARITD